MHPPKTLLETLQQRLDQRQAESGLRSLSISSSTSIDFSSNDFLSLSSCSQLRAAYVDELQRHADFPLGSRGSRLLDGNSHYAEALEQDIATFHGAPAGLLFNSGFDANSGLFACIAQAGDVLLYDSQIHASVHEGMRLSRTTICVPFAHNCLSSLRHCLHQQLESNAQLRSGTRNVFVAVEAIYSMDGDCAPLAEIVELVEQLLPLGNGHVIVDEAHSTGVIGPRGRGLVCQLGLEQRVFARLHTFGKALACSGAILLCSPITRQYLINYARPLIYTTFMSFPSLAAIRVAYDFMMAGHSEPLAADLQTLVQHLFMRLSNLKQDMMRHSSGNEILLLPDEAPPSPIFALITPKPRSLAKYCQDAGFVVRPIVAPTVPTGTERVRVCLHAGNTMDQIDRLVARVRAWAEAAELLQSDDQSSIAGRSRL